MLQENKAAVICAPCLVLIDFTYESKKLLLYIDASLVAFGGVLTVKYCRGIATTSFL